MVDQILRLEVGEGSSEFCQRNYRILKVGLHEKIEVFGGAGLSMNGDGIAAYDKVSNAESVEPLVLPRMFCPRSDGRILEIPITPSATSQTRICSWAAV
jgi:hypothetical protein